MNNNKLAPVVIFTYNRLKHTIKTVSSLKRNELADKSELIIFSDGPKKSFENKEEVQKVRYYLKSIKGFKSLKIYESKNNKGLANSIIDGVTKIVNKYGKIIVVEDDIVTSPYFLRFMNDALNMYENETDVICIHGYNVPIKEHLPQTFFLKGADCWGWATWKRGWELFEEDGKKLVNEIRKCKIEKEFDVNGAFKMLNDQINGKINSWAIRWLASAYINNKLCLYPGKSLVKNIGFDNSGVHCGEAQELMGDVLEVPFLLEKIDVEENIKVIKLIEKFNKKNNLKKTLTKYLINCKQTFNKIFPIKESN